MVELALPLFQKGRYRERSADDGVAYIIWYVVPEGPEEQRSYLPGREKEGAGVVGEVASIPKNRAIF